MAKLRFDMGSNMMVMMIMVNYEKCRLVFSIHGLEQLNERLRLLYDLDDGTNTLVGGATGDRGPRKDKRFSKGRVMR